MAQGNGTLFTNEELDAFSEKVLVTAPHYVEIACGCTNKRLGDSLVILRISDDGFIRSTCHCTLDCKEVFSSPAKFVKHASGCLNVPNWRTKIWVLNSHNKKIKLAQTCLLRYYKGDEYVRPRNKVSHRDQFLRCCLCNKVRRFEFKTEDVFKSYHFAAARENRTCSDMSCGRWTCEDLEERSSKPHSGCRKSNKCKGCKYCVCFGCEMCRFVDCECQACADFYANTRI